MNPVSTFVQEFVFISLSTVICHHQLVRALVSNFLGQAIFFPDKPTTDFMKAAETLASTIHLTAD